MPEKHSRNENPMKTTKLYLLFILLVSLSLRSFCQEKELSFIALGTSGGYFDHDLSCFLLYDHKTDKGILLDGGSIFPGLQKAADNKAIPCDIAGDSIYHFAQEHISACLVTHPHLDHIAGLAIYAAEAHKLPVYGRSYTIEVLQEHIFNWDVWPNFTDSGKGYPLGNCSLTTIHSDTVYSIPETDFSFEAFPLSHGNNGYPSTAYLISCRDKYFLFFGDTGADRIEKQNFLNNIWHKISPLLNENKLTGIAIECSYNNATPEEKLFGHLTPYLLEQELTKLITRAGSIPTDQNTNIYIYHIKPSSGNKKSVQESIREQLNTQLPFNFIIPEQGCSYELIISAEEEK